jgi:hypothetical protein
MKKKGKIKKLFLKNKEEEEEEVFYLIFFSCGIFISFLWKIELFQWCVLKR